MTSNQDTMIQALIDLGGSRWTKGNYDRIYFNAKALGLRCSYYKTGNISSATLGGEHISNTSARKLQDAKTYYDIKTGEVVSTEWALERKLNEMIKKIA